MTFLNPLLLYGMAAIAAPIIIHFFMNRRVKVMAWAAMRFLQTIVHKNQKRMNIEDLILLALRCLLLILLSLALARPILGHNGGAAGAGKVSETAVIAIDNSYSMGHSDSSMSRFDQARAAAEKLIDSLPSGSSVAVFLFSDLVRASIPEPTFDMNLARKVVRDATLSNRTTDVHAVVSQAMDTLGRHPSLAQGIYLITDGQASGWKKFNDTTSMLRNPKVRSRVILVGDHESHNLCVSGLRQSSQIAAVGDAIQFEVEVTNYGENEAKDVPVRISIDDEAPCDEGSIISIPAKGGAKSLTLTAKFRTGGYHTVTGAVNADHLPTDDQRTIAVQATDDINILLVDGDTSAVVSDGAAFYLRNALTPVPASERDKYVIKTKTITPEELDSTKLDDFEAIVLADVPDVSASALEGIAAYLKRGGGLIIFSGPNIKTGFYNDNLGKKFAFLPATLGAIRGMPKQTETFFSLQGPKYTHPIVSLWNDTSAGTLTSARFYQSYELQPASGHTALAGEAQVILKYSDGFPAIMGRTWGRGRVILFGSTANTAWNDLALRPAYLPLMERTLGAILIRQDDQLNLAVGSAFEFVCDPEWVTKDAIVMAPGEDKGGGSMRRIGMRDGVPLLRFEETEKSGAYQARIKSDPPAEVKFAVQPNTEESNLADLEPVQLDALASVAQVIRWTPEMHLDEQISRRPGGAGTGVGAGGSELWVILTSLVIVAACVELVLGGLFSASK